MFRALHSSPPPPIECGHHPQRALGSQSSPFCLPLPRLLRIRSESGFACPGHFTQVEIPFCGLASVFSPCRVGRVEPRCLTGQSCVPFFGSVMCHVCRHQLCSPAGGHGPFHFGARTEPCCSVCSSFSVNTFPAPLGDGQGWTRRVPRSPCAVLFYFLELATRQGSLFVYILDSSSHLSFGHRPASRVVQGSHS